MPQKQPPATTAGCSALAVAIGASTDGLGTAVFARSPAMQADTPANVKSKTIVDKREKKLDITNPLVVPDKSIWRTSFLLESVERQKLRLFDPIRGRSP